MSSKFALLNIVGIHSIHRSIGKSCHGDVHPNERYTSHILRLRLNGNPISGANIQYILATHVRTLIFYEDTTMIWAAQLNFIPISIKLANLGDGYKAMITLLSDEFRVSVGYLGTEPSFFRMPVTDSRFIDFEARQQELATYEEQIASNTKNTTDTVESDAIKILFELQMDSQSVGFEVFNTLVFKSGYKVDIEVGEKFGDSEVTQYLFQ